MTSTRNILIISLVINFVVIFIIVRNGQHYNAFYSQIGYTDGSDGCKIFKTENETSNAMKYALSNFKKCLFVNSEINHKEEHMFLRHLQGCLSKHIPIEIREFLMLERYDMGNKEAHLDRKFFLQLEDSFPQDKCIWLTVGIGGELAKEEKLFKKRYPKCAIFGIEASDKSYGDFNKIGKIIPHAVGVEDGNVTIMTMDCCKNGMKFIKKNLEVRAMQNLLDEYVQSRIIHFSNFDLESMEHVFMDELVYDGKLTKNNVTFCQIAWEMHLDEHYEKLGTKLNKISTMLKLVSNSPYLPILVSPAHGYHHITLLNLYAPECEQAFKIKSRFLNRHIC